MLEREYGSLAEDIEEVLKARKQVKQSARELIDQHIGKVVSERLRALLEPV